MPISRPEIHKDDIAASLWRKYERSEEYQSQNRTESISSVHPLVKAAESNGLAKVIRAFVGELVKEASLRTKYENRAPGDWVDEWKSMHELLFKGVFKSRGSFRPNGHDVRFGSPGDEELHRIPWGGGQTTNEAHMLGRQISEDLKFVSPENVEAVCAFLARSHYGFIRIHPFGDGNGRIGRALTDQLALSLGYPPVIAGFPRLNSEKKTRYHTAITGCIGNPSCYSLAAWIKEQIEIKISEIA